MLLTIPYKFVLSLYGKTNQKARKTNTSCMFNANDTSARRYVCPIQGFLVCRLGQDYFNIIKVNIADMSYAESKTIHKNITNIQPGAKNNILIYKKECNAIATEMTTRRIVHNVLMKTKLSR